MKIADKDKILVNLALSPKEWNRAHDLIGSGDMFIGYEVSARLTNAEQSYPHIIESRQNGKYKERRLRIEKTHEWLQTLQGDLARAVDTALEKSGKRYQRTELVYEPTGSNTVQKITRIITVN